MKKKKSNLLMKGKRISMFLSLFILFQVFGFTLCRAQSAEEPKLTVTFKDATFMKVLEYIKENTDYDYMCNNEEMKKIPLITRVFESTPVSKILEECLKNTEYTFVINRNVIVIQKKQPKNTALEQIILRGKVFDEDNQPLPGASVVVKGTRFGITSDVDGKFQLSLPKMDTVRLTISFMGMKEQTLIVTNFTKEITVKMVSDTKQVEEVVITGYSNIRKSSFTGSSVTVSQKELLQVSRTNILKGLEVFDPSFRIKSNNEWGSDPNSLPDIQIRGISSINPQNLDKSSLSKANLENSTNLPLFIRDGFIINLQKVYDMDPNRVKSITILKDAAATAQYGSRASNGVVLITTIPPKPGEVVVHYSLNGTIEMPDLTDYNLMNAREKLEAEVAAGLYDFDNDDSPFWTTIFKREEYQEKLKNVLEGVDTYWMSKPLQTSFSHKHSLNFEGGSQEFRYGFNFSYNGKDGVMKGSSRDRTEAGFIFEYRTETFRMRNEITYNLTKAKVSPYGSFSYYTKAMPYEKYRDENGNLLRYLKWSQLYGSSYANPLYEAQLGNYEKETTKTLTEAMSLEWDIIPGLKLKGDLAVTQDRQQTKKFIDPNSVQNESTSGDDDTYVGSLSIDNSERVDWDGKVSLSFNRSIDLHDFNIVAAMTIQTGNSHDDASTYRGFQSSEFSSPSFARDMPYKPSYSDGKNRLLSFMGTLNYSYNNVYFLDATLSMDGSSAFGEDRQWAPFFSGGFGVNIHNYSLLKDNGWLTNLRLRVTYGRTGNNTFSPYDAKPTHKIDIDTWYASGPASSLIDRRGNPDLEWEQKDGWNFGTDIGFWNGLIDITVDYYYTITKGNITDVTLVPSTGFSSYKSNMGKTVNKGIELQLNSRLITRKDLLLSVYGNISHYTNKLEKISDALRAYNEEVDKYYTQEVNYWDVDKPDLGRPLTKYEEGSSLSAIYGMKSLGIDPATGQELYLYRDGSVGYDFKGSEMQVIGDNNSWSGHFGFNFQWKGFSLFSSFKYEFGGDFYNQTLVDKVENADFKRYNVDRRARALRWEKFGDVVNYKDIRDENSTTYPTTRFIQKNNYLEWSSLTIGYDFNSSFVRKLGLQLLRIEAGANNLWRISTSTAERGLSYPFSNSVDFTLTVNF